MRLILRSFGIVALEHAHSFDSKKIKGIDFPFWLCSIFFHRAFTLAVKALSPVVSALSLAVRALSLAVRALSLEVKALSPVVRARDRANYLNYI